MRFLIIIGVVQFVLLSFVLVQQFSLKAELAEAKLLIAKPDLPAAQSSSNQQAPLQGLSKAQIRSVIRQELVAFAGRQPQDAEPVAASLTEIDELDSNQSDKLEELGTHIDYLLSDGDFSATDMKEFEDSLATLPPGLRQELLNKFAKSITKSNTNLTR